MYRAVARVSPLAVPVLLEIGRETVRGEAEDELLEEAAAALIAEATAPFDTRSSLPGQRAVE